jgi:hypothetical protein
MHEMNDYAKLERYLAHMNFDERDDYLTHQVKISFKGKTKQMFESILNKQGEMHG